LPSAERFDHRGAIGLWIAGGIGVREGTTLGRDLDGGGRFPIDVSLSFALPDTQNSIWVQGQLGLGGGSLEWATRAGYRSYFGEDRFKTFLDVGAAFQITPRFAASARVGAGVIWDFSPIAGVFAAAGVEVGGGNGFHFAADLVGGIELRTYLLE
jgi:hypothetical protein